MGIRQQQSTEGEQHPLDAAPAPAPALAPDPPNPKSKLKKNEYFAPAPATPTEPYGHLLRKTQVNASYKEQLHDSLDVSVPDILES